VKGTEFVEN